MSPSSLMKVLDPHCKPSYAADSSLSFASAQLSECLQRCLTPQSVPPGLALPAAPPGLPAPLALPAAALGPLTPLLPPMPEVDMGVESSPETAEMPADKMTSALRSKEGAELIAGQLSCLSGPHLDAFCFELVSNFLSDLCRLSCDAFAGPVLCQLLQLPQLSPKLRRRVVMGLKGSLLKLTRDKRGCWVLQQALECSEGVAELQDAFKEELKGKVLSCSQHLHGNFVLQKCVEALPPTAVAFIAAELKNHALVAALDVYSCRVLQRLIEHSHSPHMAELTEKLLRPDNLERLVTDAYGHNVLRALLVHGSEDQLRRIVALFAEEGKLLVYARNRHASLVVDQCLETLSSSNLQVERGPVMAALLGEGSTSVFSLIALDRFGNYIVQRAIAGCRGGEELRRLARKVERRIVELLTLLGPRLRRTANGRHIMCAARRRFGSELLAAQRS